MPYAGRQATNVSISSAEYFLPLSTLALLGGGGISCAVVCMPSPQPHLTAVFGGLTLSTLLANFEFSSENGDPHDTIGVFLALTTSMAFLTGAIDLSSLLSRPHRSHSGWFSLAVDSLAILWPFLAWTCFVFYNLRLFRGTSTMLVLLYTTVGVYIILVQALKYETSLEEEAEEMEEEEGNSVFYNTHWKRK